MKVLFYVLAIIFGLLGMLGLLRGCELLFLAGIFKPAQFLFAVVGILLAYFLLQKARAK